MKLVHKKHPNIKVVIAGKGRFHFDIELYRKLCYVEILNRYIPEWEIAQLLHNCLFAVCPYRDATQSGVVQTAFSAGVPLIVTDVGGLPEAVKDGVTGLVIPPNDVNSLKMAIENLIESPDLLKMFKKNIDKIWYPTMNWGPVADKYIQCYEDLLNGI